MSHPDDPLASLAQSLTEDFNQHSGDQVQAGIDEREHWLAGVPAVTELALTRKVRKTLMIYSVFMLALGCGILGDGKAMLTGAVFLLVGLFLLTGVWLHRHAGKDVLMRLTHTHLWLRNFKAQLDLQDVTGIQIGDSRIMRITLTLREGAALPGCTNSLGPLTPHVKLKSGRAPQVRLTMLGLELNGKTLTPEEVMEMLHTHCAAARITAELNMLKARQSA